MVTKNLEISYLLDFYGDVLTEKQRDVMEQYYNDDLSLSEIADNFGITRQGVATIKRGGYDHGAGGQGRLARRYRAVQEGIESLEQLARDAISQQQQLRDVEDITALRTDAAYHQPHERGVNSAA
ncbi:MAG: sigma factor-like helix-turn-helix DNA-binding protein [Ruthenibacterium lactatiformans]